MSTSPLRAAMVPVTRRFRAFFAPVNRGTGAPTLFDPGKYGVFPLDQPPSPWIDLGWIDNFQRFCGVPTQPVRAGTRGGPVSQYRGVLDARLEFDFREWGKLQMALAGGSEHMNVLASNPNANPQPSGGTPILAAAALTGSTANEIVVGVGVVDGFAIGDMIAVDNDYAQQTGYVGTGISAAYVEDPLDVNRDVNYIRRVTFNLGRVAQKTVTSLVLAQSLLGGTPPSNAGVQKVVAFVDREGGTFFQEWSALFVAEDESGGRVCLHYPRLSPTTAIETLIPMTTPPTAGRVKVLQREKELEIAKPVVALALHAAFQAMAHVDENDGQVAVCYRSYFPALMAAVY
jgi:hypothetical protein